MIQEFVDCFVKYEERTREETDDDGNTTEETYLVAVPLTSQTEIYSNIRSRLQAVNDIDQANAIEIYYRMVYGVGAPTEGDGFVEWSDWSGTLSPEAYEAICSDLPEGEAGSLAVQLAMTRLGDPYSQAKRGQGTIRTAVILPYGPTGSWGSIFQARQRSRRSTVWSVDWW